MCEVTIAIPVYNVEKYIKESIQSVLDQTFNDYELLIVDDCGNDNSMAIAKKTLSNSDRKITYRIIRQPENLGLGIARNTMIKEAKGKYIFFLDSDDTISTSCITNLHEAIIKYDLEFVCSSTAITDDQLNVKSTQIFSKNIITDNQTLVKKIYCSNFGISLYTSFNKMYKTSFLKEKNIFFTDGIYYEDSFFFLKLIYNTKRCAFLDNITYFYRQRDNSIMNSSSASFSKKHIHDMTYTLMQEKNYIIKFKESDMFGVIFYKFASRCFNNALAYIKHNTCKIPIKQFINDILKCPLTITEICSLNNIRKEMKLKLLIFWIFDKLPYVAKYILLKYIQI